ncbi:hypothetical protein Cgig2_007083 [Carnegiea gigantea]|uniref:Zinc finger, BED-type n=1 Tax=Carnegiea gigantea TaxID=171969 RepID=A0A9Q1Q6H4_9CARY|nr:hypothetical protein Cgig2_007083 [Carnegiea gigantea]
MDIEGEGNEIHANENLNSISTMIALDALVEDDKKEVQCGYMMGRSGKKRTKCSHCKKATFIAIVRYGTSNMKKHLEKCKAYQATKSSEGGGEKRFKQKVYRDLLARVIIRHGYSFSWVDHEGNRAIHTYLNNEVRTITRNTAKADCLKWIEFKNWKHKRKFDYLVRKKKKKNSLDQMWIGEVLKVLDFPLGVNDGQVSRFRRLLRLWLLLLAQIWRPRRVAFLLLL